MSTEIIAPSNGRQENNNTTILIIEDEEKVRMFIADYLSTKGYNIIAAEDGESGLDLFRQKHPDLVLLDLRLPRIDGFDVLHRISENSPDIPVIIVSGKGTVNDVIAALKTGAWDYITKPIFDYNVLHIAVVSVLERAQLLREKNEYEKGLGSRDDRFSDLRQRSIELEKAYIKLNREIIEHKRAERAIVHERSFIQTIIDGLKTPAMIISPTFEVLMMNQAALALLPSHQTNLTELTCHQAYRQSNMPCAGKNHQCALQEVLKTNQPVTLLHKDASTDDNGGHIYKIEASPLWNPDGSLHGILEVFRNVTENLDADTLLREHQDRLYHLLHHDALTNLPNRLLLQDRLSRMLLKARRNNNYVAVLFLNLDRFKKINESLGHDVGDKLLQAVAKRLENCVRKSDTVARLAGDEFTILLDDLTDAQHAAIVARKIIHALSKPVMIRKYELYATGCIGISLYPGDGLAVDDLLRCAETALNRAKKSGETTYHYYTPDMNARSVEFLLLESGMRKALEHEEFVIYYQPLMNLADNRLIGMEALLRWRHPEKGMIPPGDFIPLAEETGLIEPIGDWVLKTACAKNKEWQDAGYPPIKVSINMSARQFSRKNLAETIGAILKNTGLLPQYLNIEITESVIMQDVNSTIAKLQELHDMGVCLSIDDFGTGYSSLSYLRLFPIDILKIDRSFVFNLTSESNDAAIANSIIQLAHSMNLKVVAEGVETQEQLEILRHQGCDFVQGFLFSRPLSAEDFIPFFDQLLK